MTRSVSVAGPGVYAACLQTAVDLAAPVARHIVARAGDSLLQRAAASTDLEERKRQLEAARLLTEHRDRFRSAFPGALQREFETLEQEDAGKSRAFSFETLELMREEEVDETVEAVRAQQMVLSGVEAEVGHLNALICAAKGRSTVAASANPLRPEAWVNALRAACEQCPAPGWVRARWLAHLSEALAPELASVYRQLADMLKREGVSAASFTVTGSTRAAPAPAAALARQRDEPAPLLNLRDLRRLLAVDAAPAGAAPLASAAAAPSAPAQPHWAATEPAAAPAETVGLTVPYAFEALQQMTRLDEVMQRIEQRRAAGELVDAATPDAPVTPAQALGQEVVRVMVDKIADDRRLVRQVRQAVRQLQPALLRLARNDPRFFRDQQHPTRRFLTEMTERSLAWPASDLPGFAEFFEPLRQAVIALADLRMDTAEPFEFALRSLTETWDQQEERARHERARAARALMKAERRNLLARRIGERLRERPDVLATAPDIRRFIVGAWAQVMAAAQMADPSGATDPGGYSAVLDDLLWSTSAMSDPLSRTRLAKLLPGLVSALRGGLASIEYPEDRARHFLHLLADMYRASLPQDEAEPRPAAPRPPAAVPHPADEHESDFWLEPTEARASSLMQIGPAMAPVPQGESLGGTMATVRASPLPLAITRLQSGAWVDLYLDGAWGRWRLSWASPQALLFMFGDGSGHYKSMTRSVLETLNAVGALRFVSSETIVQGALDAVAEAALRNSTQSASLGVG